MIFQECETLNAELAKKRSLIQDAKKKMDDAKEVSDQYRSLDGQFKSLSKDQEDLRFNLLNIEVIFYFRPFKQSFNNFLANLIIFRH